MQPYDVQRLYNKSCSYRLYLLTTCRYILTSINECESTPKDHGMAMESSFMLAIGGLEVLLNPFS